MARWVLHVDLDQFIAAVEVLRHPELRGRPVVVGGDGDPTKRGVVSTASYEAREHGVHSGLPLRTAAKRLPDAVFLPVDRAAYEEISETVMEVLRSTGAVVEVLGWDEAFVGVDTEDPEAFGRSLARQVRETTQLDCTVGIGENKLQAKIATGFGKPAGPPAPRTSSRTSAGTPRPACRTRWRSWPAVCSRRSPPCSPVAWSP